jgi:DNA-binding protein HU-beta
MRKPELAEKISLRTNLDRHQSAAALDAALELIAEALSDGDEVVLTGFGKFMRTQRRGRRGVNPRTGEAMTIPTVAVPAFVAGAALKRAVRG